jgi:hypothetical protein
MSHRHTIYQASNFTLLHKEPAMIPHSQLERFGLNFPHDRDGHVPEATDDWRKMSFDHGALDPEEPAISAAERQRRIDHLDTVWWPQVLAEVRRQHDELVQRGEPSPLGLWAERMKPDGGVVGPAISVAPMD